MAHRPRQAVRVVLRVPAGATAVAAWLPPLWRRRTFTAGRTGALIPGKHEELGIDQQQFGGGFFKVAARIDSRANRVQPVGRNGFDTLFATGHEREGPEWMTLTVGTMTGGFTAATMGECE